MQGAVQPVHAQKFFQAADLFAGIFVHADGQAVQLTQVVAVDAVVVCSCQQGGIAGAGAVVRVGKILLEPLGIKGAAQQIKLAGKEARNHFLGRHIHKFIFPAGVFCDLGQIIQDQAGAGTVRLHFGKALGGRKRHLHDPGRLFGVCGGAESQREAERRKQARRRAAKTMKTIRFHTKLLYACRARCRPQGQNIFIHYYNKNRAEEQAPFSANRRGWRRSVGEAPKITKKKRKKG